MTLGLATSRRTFLGAGAAAGMAAALSSATAAPKRPDVPAGDLARDENYWARVAALYDVDRTVVNLENGYWGIMAKPVLLAYRGHTERVNRDNTYYARRDFATDMQRVYGRVAEFLGVGTDEVLLTRGATEALQTLIGGYNGLKPGDAVLYADLDYDAMKTAMRWLEERRGVTVIRIAIPEPATRENVIAAYESAFNASPNLKLALLTYVNNLTGLVHPVAEIAALAKARGVAVILDAAHALGQIDFKLSDLGVDFAGFNLHKWIGAPIGCGLIYIRKDRIPDIDRHFGEPGEAGDIRARIHTGTLNFAAHLSIPAALDFHDEIGGSAAKGARVRHLRNLWVAEARQIAGVDILTPDDASMTCALTSFRFRGKTTGPENIAIAKTLAEEHKVFVVRRTGPENGDCLRVTPALFTSRSEVLKLPAALRAMAGLEE